MKGSLEERAEQRGGGQGGDEAAPPWRGSSFEPVMPSQALACGGCGAVFTDAGAARGCERGHEETGDLERATPCEHCRRRWPFHRRECATGPRYCEGCSAYTTHCAGDHCLNCCVDDYGYPTEDCCYCYAEVGGLLRISAEGSELLGVETLPDPAEIHDLHPTPFED